MYFFQFLRVCTKGFFFPISFSLLSNTFFIAFQYLFHCFPIPFSLLPNDFWLPPSCGSMIQIGSITMIVIEKRLYGFHDANLQSFQIMCFNWIKLWGFASWNQYSCFFIISVVMLPIWIKDPDDGCIGKQWKSHWKQWKRHWKAMKNALGRKSFRADAKKLEEIYSFLCI